MISRRSPLKRGAPPRRSTKPIARSSKRIRPRNPARQDKNFTRAYGSLDRVEFVNAKPCGACGVRGFTVNAHCPPTIEAGGTGYKADAKWIAPLCGDRLNAGLFVLGCHNLYDEHPETFARLYPKLDVQALAADTERRWLEHQAGV